MKKWVSQAVIMATINIKKQTFKVMVKVEMKIKIQAVHSIMMV